MKQVKTVNYKGVANLEEKDVLARIFKKAELESENKLTSTEGTRPHLPLIIIPRVAKQ